MECKHEEDAEAAPSDGTCSTAPSAGAFSASGAAASGRQPGMGSSHMVEDVACRGDRRTAQMYSIAAISIAEPSLCLAASSYGSNLSVVWQAFYGWRQRVEVAWRAAMAAQTTMMPRQAALLQVRAEAVREAFDTWREASQRQPHGVPSKPHGVPSTAHGVCQVDSTLCQVHPMQCPVHFTSCQVYLMMGAVQKWSSYGEHSADGLVFSLSLTRFRLHTNDRR